MFPRRHFLLGAGAMVAGLGLPFGAARAAEGADRKILFVFAPGGWDPTRVFADGFDHVAVDMEPDAERASAGGLPFVDHPDRPSVRAFFESHHDRMLVFNGLLVRSIAHEICTMIAMTGSASGNSPDWPAILGEAQRDRYTLPHLVLDGPSYPGPHGVAVARAGRDGQLEALLCGEALERSDQVTGRLSLPGEAIVDRYLARRAAAEHAVAGSVLSRRLTADFETSHEQLRALLDLRYTMDFATGTTLASQIPVAVEALSLGVSRCVTVAATGGQLGWDTHADNDAEQSPLWDDLFADLARLLSELRATPGHAAPTLADETLVVVLSEMGRTPALNPLDGKDHWPYTSALLVGPGFTGDRVIGGFDASWYGRPVDPASGETTDDGPLLSAEALGATILALADIDPEDHVDASPIEGVIS